MGIIFDPSIAFSGFIGAIIIALFTSPLLIRNPFRIKVAPEEKQFMNSGLKLVRHLYLAMILTVSISLYIILITSIDKNYKHAWIHKIVTKMITTNVFFVLCIIFFVLIIILSFKWIQKIITVWVYEKQDTKRRRIVAFFIIFGLIIIYCILFATLYGLIVNETLINGSQFDFNKSSELLINIHLIDNKSIFLIVFLTVLNYFLFLPIIRLSKFILRSEILVDIYCNNGNFFCKKYLINYNVDGNLLVGDSSDILDSNKYLLSKDTITQIEFTTVHYIFGKLSEASGVVLPKDFTAEEKKIITTLK